MSVWKKFGNALGISKNTGASAPPVDLDKPVENPRLVAALKRAADDDSDEAKDRLFREIQRANFLVAIYTDEMRFSPTPTPGHMIIQQGSRIKVLSLEAGGENYLPLFTDWAAIRAYTDDKVNTLVFPAADAWLFALKDKAYQGVVINPAGDALPMDREMLEYLCLRSTKK